MIKNYFSLVVLAMALPFTSLAYEQATPQLAKQIKQVKQEKTANSALELLVFKTPTCGCCKKWVSHIEQQGIVAHSKDFDDLSPIKSRYGIKPNYRSCHTAITREGFVFEGHVPAKFVKQFMDQPRDNAIGLSVPAMPVGSPGMEVGERFMPYKVLILFNDGTSEVFASVNRYEEQF